MHLDFIPLIFTLLFAPLYLFGAENEQCPTYAIDTKYMTEYPDQGDTGLCFAFAASDILSHFYKKSVLPYDVAIKNFRYLQSESNRWAIHDKEAAEKTPIRGGWISKAIFAATKEDVKICLNDEKFPFYNKWSEISSIFEFLQKDDPIRNTCSKHESNEVILQTVSDFKNIVKNQQHIERLEAVFEKMCGDNKISLDENKIKGFHRKEAKCIFCTEEQISKNLKSENDLLKEFNSSLSKGIPIGIEYNIAAIRKADGNHASTVIGMRYNLLKKKCEVLVKDTHGKKCNPPADTVDCINGNYWVDTSRLFSFLSSTIWIE